MKRFSKSFLSTMLIACMFVTMMGSAAAMAATNTASTKTGAWSINRNMSQKNLTEEQQKIFKKATKRLDGVEYTPIAVIGEQVVAGMNYAYLCKAKTVTLKPKTTLQVVVVYCGINKKPKITAINRLRVSNVRTTERPEKAVDSCGGWSANTSLKKVALPEDIQKSWDKAVAKLDGVTLKPVALLGSQVVSGMQYRLLCVGRFPSLKGGRTSKSLEVVTLYVNARGKATITESKPLNLEYYIREK